MTLKNQSKNNKTIFENIKEIDENGNEFWGARKLAKILEYSEFRHFLPVIEKAKIACNNSNIKASDHIEQFLDMVHLGSGAKREIKNFKLSRYACYLIVQNADPSKEVVAAGQTYFAIQTRLQEVQQMKDYKDLTTEDEKRLFLRNELKQHNLKLASTAKIAGVISSFDYATFQNHGYMGLYGIIWRIRCKSNSFKKRFEEKSTDIRPYGINRTSCQSIQSNTNRRKIAS